MMSPRNSRSASDSLPIARSDGAKLHRFVTIDQVADALNVSARTVRRWIESRKLVAHRFGASVRIAVHELNAFLAVHRDG